MPGQTQNEHAVAFVCDQNFVRFALFMIWQIAHHNPNRTFDFVIYSPDEITLPDWAKPYGIIVHRAAPIENVPNHALFAGTAITLYRINLARDLGHRYRRIVYLDCDMFIEGGDFNRLIEADLGNHPIGGALNSVFFYRPNHHSIEFLRAGMGRAPYFNSGLLLIDTRAFLEQDVDRRAFEAMRRYPQAIILGDQSMLNLALRGKFAELAPCWNWQMNARLPLMTHRYPVFVRHFITGRKPDRDSTSWFDARFNLAYREFFSRLMPEALATLAPPCDHDPLSMRDIGRYAWLHFASSRLTREILARHPDPYRPLIDAN